MVAQEIDLRSKSERAVALASFVNEINQSGRLDSFFLPQEGKERLPGVKLSIKMVEGKYLHNRGGYGDTTDQGCFFMAGELGFVLNAQVGENPPTLVAVTSFNLTRTRYSSVRRLRFWEYHIEDEESVFPRIMQLQGLTKQDSLPADNRRQLALSVMRNYNVWDGLVRLTTEFTTANNLPAIGIIPSSKSGSKSKPEFNARAMFQRYDQYALDHGFRQVRPNGFYLKRFSRTRK